MLQKHKKHVKPSILIASQSPQRVRLDLGEDLQKKSFKSHRVSQSNLNSTDLAKDLKENIII